MTSSARRDVVVDSGPLIALFDADDVNHQLVKQWYRGHWFRGCTTLAVITEVSYSLSYRVELQLSFLKWVREGALRIVELTDRDFDRCIGVIEKISDLPADFADATLVAIADRLAIREVVTFDGDFRIYRYRRRQTFLLPLLDPA